MSTDSSNSEALTPKFSLRADRLRFAREQRGISQRELARLCGISLNQVHRYESGSIEPTAPTLASIAHELAISSDYLLGLSDVPTSNAPENLRPDERQLLEAYTLGDSARLFVLITNQLRNLGKDSP